MTEKDTMDTARALMNYLRGRVDTPQVTMKIEGETRPFYNDRELTHLADVRVLFAGGYRLMYTALVVTLVIAALLIFAAPRSSWLANLWNTMVIGGLGAVGVLVAVGLLVATDFERLFWTFHIVSFSNDMWLLDPATDWLIRMFPESFFYHAAVRIVVTAVLFLTAIAVVGIWQRTRAARKSIATSTD
jgi:integral membrane protein (TIGR01906 family)